MQLVKRRRNAGRADQFAGVRCEQQPGPLGDPEGRREVRGRTAPLVVGKPEPGDPWPAYCAASRASVRASIGCLVRLAAMMIPIPMSAARAAFSAASSSSSVYAVIPPYLAANPEGSACSSSHRDPSARSSSAISRKSR